MKNRSIYRKIMTVILAVCLCCGCADEEASLNENSANIVLNEPVSVTAAYDIVRNRDIFRVSVFSGTVVPEVTAYEFSKDQTFEKYFFSPGQQVKAGDVLATSKLESIEDDISALAESISDMEQDFNDDVDALNKDISDAKDNEFKALEPLAKMYEYEPEEWNDKAMDQFNRMILKPDGMYKRAKMQREQLEEQLRQRQELFELEHQYNVDKLERLENKKKDSDIISTLDGDIVSIGFYYDGDFVPKESPIVAVGDMSARLLKTDYISAGTYNKAEDVYAIINGKRYELNYREIPQDKVNQMKRASETIYTTFEVVDPEGVVQIGDFASIIMVSESRRDVPAVPLDALKMEDGGYYAYLFDGEESTYVPVQIGMKDGIYAEVLTGLNVGDKVLSDSAVKKGANVRTVEYGECSNAVDTSGYLFYPTSEWLTNPAKTGTCYIKEILVGNNQQVTKGETVATIEVTADKTEVDRLTRQIQRAQERLVTLNKKKEENDGKKIIDRSVERSITEKNKTINKLMRQVKKLTEYSGIVEIKAPFDGIITDKGTLKEGDLIYYKSAIVQISDSSLSYVIVKDDNNQLSYGDSATINVRMTAKGSTPVVGTVCTVSNTSLPMEMRQEWRLISVPKERAGEISGSTMSTDGRWDRNSFKVNVTTRQMQNVLVVPKSAVTVNGGCTYVTVVNEDGTAEVKSFIAGGSDAANYWVVEGLEEGMQVCWG